MGATGHLRIAIDAHSVGVGLGGNESYATNLIEALAEIDSQNHYTLYVTKRAALERYRNRWANFSVCRTAPHSPVIRIPLTLSIELRRRPVDVLHVQYTAPPLTPCPIVSTIHDLAFEHLPETFKRRSWMQLRLTVRSTARRAAQIITLSDHSKRDIVETYGISPDRISVTPAAAPHSFKPISDNNELRRVRQTYGIESDYILSVGAIQPRKNLARLVAAYSRLRHAHPQGKLPTLVIVGKRAWLYGETLRTIEELELTSSVILTGYVPESDLPALYSGAICFAYLSYFEGFGLPLVEAMKCGTPVIAGNRTSSPEVVGEAGMLVDPFQIDDIAAAIKRVVFDSDFRSDLKIKGLERARLFDWRETAKQTLAVYQKAASVNGRPLGS